ncbi:MAG: transposase [Candidatus Moranbacteria bacterium]|nr:transposase [Candidatus Moranbacteria bacterium]
MRKTELANGEYYHIYNRGVDKREIFLDGNYYFRFLKDIKEFNNNLTREERLRASELNSESELSSDEPEKLVNVVCYCLNPNHYHFILQQLTDNGIEKFMHKLSTGYTNYFNQKNERSGALFQGRYKSIHINSNEYLLYLSAYVNLNSEIHKIAKASDYKWCSFPDYIGKRNRVLCNKEIILGQFKDLEEYKKYAKINAEEMRKKKEMEKLLLE